MNFGNKNGTIFTNLTFLLPIFVTVFNRIRENTNQSRHCSFPRLFVSITLLMGCFSLAFGLTVRFGMKNNKKIIEGKKKILIFAFFISFFPISRLTYIRYISEKQRPRQTGLWTLENLYIYPRIPSADFSPKKKSSSYRRESYFYSFSLPSFFYAGSNV